MRPWYFAHLDLDPTEDTGAIRRAYAVALKRIDQDSEREAFERLREAYQRALDWARSPPGEDDADFDEVEAEAEDEGPEYRGEPAAADAVPVEVAHAARIDRAPGPADAAAIDLAAAAAAEERADAIAEWIDRLMAEETPGLLAQALAQALADPRLAHLDARYEFERRLLEALHDDPDGRLPLFEAAAVAFDWRGDQLRLLGGGPDAAWLDRVIDQIDHWEGQSRLVRRQRERLLARIGPRPSPLGLLHDGPLLAELYDDYPDWLVLRLAPGRIALWEAAQAGLSPHWHRLARIAAFLDPRGMTTLRFVGLMFAAAMIIAFVQGWNRHGSDALPVGDDALPAEPALAYEFTGPGGPEACGMVESFATESNWLAVDDSLAQGLLATRILDCRMRGLWPARHDALADCLRAERLAALQADRPENLTRCDVPAADSAE